MSADQPFEASDDEPKLDHLVLVVSAQRGNNVHRERENTRVDAAQIVNCWREADLVLADVCDVEERQRRRFASAKPFGRV